MKPTKLSIALLAISTVLMSLAPAFAVYPFTTSILSVVLKRDESKKIRPLEIVTLVLLIIVLGIVIIYGNKLLEGWGLK